MQTTAAMTGIARAAAALATVLLPARALAPGAPPSAPVIPPDIRLEAPVGTVPRPVEFRWVSPFTADRFLVEVFDRAGRVVWSSSTAGNRAMPNYLEQTRMSGGRGYVWRVTAVTKSGRLIAQSMRQPFAVSSR
jgi:hypothetical protein